MPTRIRARSLEAARSPPWCVRSPQTSAPVCAVLAANTTPWPAATRRRSPSKTPECSGRPRAGSGSMSRSRKVPAAVPSVRHSSRPVRAVRAVKKSNPFAAVSVVGARSGGSAAMSESGCVPASVPSLIHRFPRQEKDRSIDGHDGIDGEVRHVPDEPRACRGSSLHPKPAQTAGTIAANGVQPGADGMRGSSTPAHWGTRARFRTGAVRPPDRG